MAKHHALSGPLLQRELRRRGYSSQGPSHGVIHGAVHGQNQRVPVSRRRFLHLGASAGALLGLPPLLAACGGGSDNTPSPPATERRTLFFNFSHESFDDTTHHLVVGANRYELTRTQDKPQVLAESRKTNKFLVGVPDDQVTHHLEAVELLANAVQLTYVIRDENKVAGTWSMSGMYLLIPKAATRSAYAMGRAGSAPAPLLHSAKRQLYNHEPAMSAQDLEEEQDLLDTSDHAAAMIGMHPELLSAEPTSAAYLHTHHIALNEHIREMALHLRLAGPAEPQKAAGASNGNGWATLVAQTDDAGTPVKNNGGTNIGLVQYSPEWNAGTVSVASQAIVFSIGTTKNDVLLGADVTESMVSGKVASVNPTAKGGAIWMRRDGVPNIDQSSASAAQLAAGTTKYTVSPDTPQAGFRASAKASGSGGDSVSVMLENWYLRYLSVYVQFYQGDTLLKVEQLPTSFKRPLHANSKTAVFFGVMTPEFTILGIPIQESRLQLDIDFPPIATHAKILATGQGDSGGYYGEDGDITNVGSMLTFIFNNCVPALMLTMGLSMSFDALFSAVVVPLVTGTMNEVFIFVEDFAGGGGKDYFNILTVFWRLLVRALVGNFAPLLKLLLTQLTTFLTVGIAASAVLNSIPLIGQIMQAVAALGVAVEIAESAAECALSPEVYATDIVRTHDVSVRILPPSGSNDSKTPALANHYRVTALFDGGGTPRIIDRDLSGPVDYIDVTFPGVPLGGRVSIDAAFMQVPTDAGKDHVMLGKASSGLVGNTTDRVSDIFIAEMKYPIGPATHYAHHSKTALRVESGAEVHVWDAGLPAPTATLSDIACGGTGDLCDFFGITVRQATAQGQGYVGYAWNGNSSGVNGCTGGGSGGQLANLNTDQDHAQSGYATLPCSLQQRPLVSYNLLAHGSPNYYFDSTQRVVRQVRLDGGQPVFDDPNQKQAFGAFRLPPTSLIQHPAGQLISIHFAGHKMESLKPAVTAMTDAEALSQGLAQLHAGQGTRPGLLTFPTAVAVSADGVVLVLEAGDPTATPPVPARIQGFDTGGNAVKYFGKQPIPYFLTLGANSGDARTYIDMAVEFTGFIYVLSYSGSATAGGLRYWLDIYHASQSGQAPVSTTQDVNAARLCVDFWRGVYTLNYEVLSSKQGRAEPSVSLWQPSI